MPLKRLFTEEQIGFAVGYTAAFVVDKFVKVSAIKYGYKTVSWVASKTKISPPTGQVLFERAVDGVWNAY
jgi:hypothetical protein